MPFLVLSAICLLDAFAVFFLVLTPTAMRSISADVLKDGENVNRDEHPIPTPMSLTELQDKIKQF